MGNGFICSIFGAKYKDIQRQYGMTDLEIGLRPNQTLYELNALLQCLCHIEDLVNYFKYKYNDDEVKSRENFKNNMRNGTCLADGFKNIVFELWPDLNTDNKNKKEVKMHKETRGSNEFSQMIYKINPQYNGNQDHLLKFLQKRLHDELNKATKENNNIPNIVDYSNKQASLKNYIKNFAKTNKSIISDIFYGTFCSNSQFFCGHVEYDFQYYTYGFYSFQQVLQYKIMTYQSRQNPLYINKNFNMNEIDVYDCLFFDRQIKNGFSICKKCSIQQGFKRENFIFSPPKILCFAFNKNENIPITNFVIETQININQFVENKEMINYDLIGIIVYFHPNRYVAYCKNPTNLIWYMYDNEKVEKINIREIIMNKYIPFMLFYQSMKSPQD